MSSSLLPGAGVRSPAALSSSESFSRDLIDTYFRQTSDAAWLSTRRFARLTGVTSLNGREAGNIQHKYTLLTVLSRSVRAMTLEPKLLLRYARAGNTCGTGLQLKVW
jgi:hypothetical protein